MLLSCCFFYSLSYYQIGEIKLHITQDKIKASVATRTRYKAYGRYVVEWFEGRSNRTCNHGLSDWRSVEGQRYRVHDGRTVGRTLDPLAAAKPAAS